MPLTDTAIKNSPFKEKTYKLADEKGMYLEIHPDGKKYWRLKYRFAGKEKRISLGVYPEISLKDARLKRREARDLLGRGIDPSQHRQTMKLMQAEQLANSFEAVAREWVSKKSPAWAASHTSKVSRRFELYVFPWLGRRPIAEITAPELLAVLRRVESQGIIDTAHRVKQTCGQVFRYAVATGRAERDPSGDLKGALTPTRSKNMAAIIDPQEIAGLLKAIDGYGGHFATKCALMLAPLVFVRPGELRNAEWSEIDFKDAVWRIPASKMKMKEPHVVPLSRQAVLILTELKPLTGNGRYLFPSLRTTEKPMSNNTVNAALRRMGFTKEEMTGHGFRAMASTILHEQGWPPDVIERQLAHAERNSVRAAYNHAQHIPQRRKMMQAWADYLDALKKGTDKIIFIRS